MYLKKFLGFMTAMVMASACMTGCGESTFEEETNQDIRITTVNDLEGKKIGTQLGTTGYIYAADINGASVSPYKKGEDAVKDLIKGSIDAVLIDIETANYFINENPSLTLLSDPFANEEYSVAYKKGNEELGKKLDSAISVLKKNGTLEEIKKHWIGTSADQQSYVPDTENEKKNGKLIMATNAEFPPYESIDDSTGEVIGFDVDMMTAVCDALGMELEIVNMNFNDIITSVNNGTADVGVAGISITPERQKNVDFTQGYADSTQVVIVRK